MKPGVQLRQIRDRLGLTIRDVERLSGAVAAAEENEDFAVSNGWLAQMEKHNSVPSLHKLYTLSVIYRVRYADLLLLYGIDLDEAKRHQLVTMLNQTHPLQVEVYDEEKTLRFPVRLDPSFRPRQTAALDRMIEMWGEIPVAMLRYLDTKNYQYGYIGLEDQTMYPILRPGSFVQIDNSRRRIASAGWRSEFERPIYFFELRDGYACCWCELRGKQLLLVPHPSSGCSTRVVPFPEAADVIGQVVGVAMRLVPHNGASEKQEPKLLDQA